MTSHEAARLAASELPQPFTFAELLLRSWHHCSEAFGLEDGKLVHPDARKLQNILYGFRGLIGTGYIVRDGEKFRSVPADDSIA